MTRPRLLVFDLDGTLIDSSTDLCHALNAALRFEGKPALPHAEIAGYIGDGAATLVRLALASSASRAPGELEAESEAVSERRFQSAYRHFLHFYREHKLNNTRAYAGVMEALGAIRAHAPHLPMAVLTNKPVRPAREICEALGLSPFFFQIYGGDSFASKKPDPEGLLVLLAEARSLLLSRHPTAPALLPGEATMIGDSPVDVQTTQRCGMRSLGCTFGLSPESLARATPDLLVDSPREWPEALGFA